ncbi:MAG: hypothetical protein ABWZ58_07625 [Acidimicrobiia bacterium]
MKYVAVLVLAVAACTPTTDPSPSTELTTVSTRAEFPCVSASGDVASDTSVTVQANDHEVAAVLGWVSAGPCSGDGDGVVSDGFFEGLEDAVVTKEAGSPLRVLAPGFDAAQFEAVWNVADGADRFVADASKVAPGRWEIVESPSEGGSYVLNLRFEYGEDHNAAFAVTVDVQS